MKGDSDMFFKKAPKPTEAQVLVRNAYDLIYDLMNNSHTIPTHIYNGMHKWLSEYKNAESMRISE